MGLDTLNLLIQLSHFRAKQHIAPQTLPTLKMDVCPNSRLGYLCMLRRSSTELQEHDGCPIPDWHG